MDNRMLITFISLTTSTIGLIVFLLWIIFDPNQEMNEETQRKVNELNQKVESVEKKVATNHATVDQKLESLEKRVGEFEALLGSVIGPEEPVTEQPIETPTETPVTETPVETTPPTEPVTNPTVPDPSSVQPQPKLVYVAANGGRLHLRSNPTTSSSIVRSMSDGESLFYLEEAGIQAVDGRNWIKVRDSAGNEGWVDQSFIR